MLQNTEHAPQGLPGEFLLVFTLLIWILFILIYLSNVKNKLNFWCFLSGMFFSMGVFKEYLYFTLNPYLMSKQVPWMTESFSLSIYSVFTAMLYYFAMPAVMVFSFHFCHLDERHPRLFRWAQVLVFVPCAVYAVFCPYTRTRYYQLQVPEYYISVAVYNWSYGILSTFMIVRTLLAERLSNRYRQRKMVAVIILLPIWYWLISAFAIHILGLQKYFKAWQGNMLIILILMIYYLYHVFRDGIWGTRLRRETYDWTGDSMIIQKNAQYVGHALKNEVSKIRWCVQLLQVQESEEKEDILKIVERSVNHLEEFINRTKIYSDQIVVHLSECDIAEVFRQCMEEQKKFHNKEITIGISACDDTPLLCDRAHLIEVLNNLIRNAYEAISEKGEISLSYVRYPRQRKAEIRVTDNGRGIPKEAVENVFDPYYTTKAMDSHMGLGLYYCYNVMEEHDGCIRIASEPGKGSSISLYFPIKVKKKRRRWKRVACDQSAGGRG